MSSSFLHYKHKAWCPETFIVPLSTKPNGTLQQIDLMKWFIIKDAKTKSMDKVSIHLGMTGLILCSSHWHSKYIFHHCIYLSPV